MLYIYNIMNDLCDPCELVRMQNLYYSQDYFGYNLFWLSFLILFICVNFYN